MVTDSLVRRNMGWVRVAALLALELLLIQLARHSYGFECYTTRYAGFCGFARNALLAGYALTAVFVMLGLFARSAFARLLAEAELRRWPLLANLAGLATLVASLPLLLAEQPAAMLTLLAVIWAVAAAALAGGAILMLAPLARWRRFAEELGWVLPLAAGAGIAAPFVATALRPLWSLNALSDMTFQVVVRIMELWGQEIYAIPETKVIGFGDFYVNIAPSCSGVEGLVLTTTFVLIYLGLFRQDMKFPQAFLILPVALLTSWLLNALRIAVLVQIGLSGQPELAVGAFHSHAGWLMFTLLSLGIVGVTQWLGLFRRTPDRPAQGLPPFLSDPVVAQILPFAVFMGSALLASTFHESPAVVYPLRAVAMAAILALVWPYLRGLPWRIDAVAVLSGAVIAVYWVATAPSQIEPAPLAGAGALVFAGWVAIRAIGTTVLVPVIEELFFRGYLMDRIAPQGAVLWRVVLAVVISTAGFAALHDRWIAAAVAGLIFALVTLRSRNLTDAIVSHGVANGLIAGWAIGTGNWGVI